MRLARGIEWRLRGWGRHALRSLYPIWCKVLPVPQLWQRRDPASWPLPENSSKSGLAKYEFSVFSQNGEDGILKYLLAMIGLNSRTFIELGFGVTENNCLRLVHHEGFAGRFIDRSLPEVEAMNRGLRAMGIKRAEAICRFVDLANLEATVLWPGAPAEIDVLSIDVDGNDFWFWKRIVNPSARVVVIEYNASFGPKLSATVPYDPIFDRYARHPSGLYHGASLAALVKLADQKGYALVGCDSMGINAFFVRRDCLPAGMELASLESAYRPNVHRIRRGLSPRDQFDLIKDLPYALVE